MKKLLQVNTVVDFGGISHIVDGIGQLAIKKGWDSYVTYGRGKKFGISNLIKIGKDWDTKVHGVETRLFDNCGLSGVIHSFDLTKASVHHINYAKDTQGLFTRIIEKISAMTILQYINYKNGKPISRVKYALI